MNKRALVVIAAATAIMSFGPLPTLAHADDRSALHRCEDVLARAAKIANSAKAQSDIDDVARCRIVVRESALRDSRMTVDENGKQVR